MSMRSRKPKAKSFSRSEVCSWDEILLRVPSGFSNMEVTYEHNENTFSRWLGQGPDYSGLNYDSR